MLELKNISKEYKTGSLVQKALDDVSLALRDNEFVAILGPSGSGKTTMLNVIGGLDRYNSGDLIIDGRSTKNYKDRDWDNYRNHTIGFVFQSYNLIPHQSVLSNVELALTIGGVPVKERKERAIKALEEVGLKDHLHKKPSQLSGGQMQRVAIARALVNNPKVLLADEPTGALDTETGIQVMELLKEVAKDRLVVMVTHNPELAHEYATRIVKVQDGKIIDDSNPFHPEAMDIKEDVSKKKQKKAGMKIATSIKLSMNNLKTKFGRTLLTAIAGSIGIIGIALILALSNGVNQYIYDIQRDTMSSYPLTIDREALDMSAMTDNSAGFMVKEEDALKKNRNAIYADTQTAISGTGISYKSNNLKAFKKYIENPDSQISKYIGTNGVVYTYNTAFSVYTKDPNGSYLNTDDNPTEESKASNSFFDTFASTGVSTNGAKNFSQITPGENTSVSGIVKDNYDLLAGKWPDKYNQVILNLSDTNSLSSKVLYQLGFIDKKEFKKLKKDAAEGKDEIELFHSYDELLGKEFYLINKSSLYEKKSNGAYKEVSLDKLNIDNYLDKSTKLEVVGIVRPKENNNNESLLTPILYTDKLTDYMIKESDKSAVVKAQEKDPNNSILTGVQFAANSDKEKVELAKKYVKKMTTEDKANLYSAMQMYQTSTEADKNKDSMAISQTFAMSPAQMAASLDAWVNNNPKDEDLIKIYDAYIGDKTYEEVLEEVGKVDKANPSAINIYTDTFDDKDGVTEAIIAYNNQKYSKDKITYTDMVGLLTSSMTTIVNVITTVLIAFVAVSLVVSSIMIGIITHISVLERTKEIGILRAMGASKRNISQVFNAETGLIGCISGLIGVGVAFMLTFPANAIASNIIPKGEIHVAMSPLNAILLVLLSIAITLVGGLIPAKKAAKKDPVAALRAE